MTKKIVLLIVCLAVAVPVFAEDNAAKRLAESTAVLTTILNKKEIPKSILDKAECVLVHPGVKKVGVGIGVSYGEACSSVAAEKRWPANGVLRRCTRWIQAASERNAGKLKLGAGASAGPSAANAAGFNDPNIDILSYSQSKGLFAGASLGEASMATDTDANKALYGKDITASQIVRGEVPVPAAGKALVDELDKISPKHM